MRLFSLAVFQFYFVQNSLCFNHLNVPARSHTSITLQQHQNKGHHHNYHYSLLPIRTAKDDYEESDVESENDADNKSSFDFLSSLKSRIQELKQKEETDRNSATATKRSNYDESIQANTTNSLAELTQRIKELSRSQSIQDKLNQFELDVVGSTRTKNNNTNQSLILDLPVICFDALLPMQKLEAQTQDPTFMLFLREIGLGGWFMMVSLDFKSRKIRRNGCLCKVEYLDTVSKGDLSEERIPTAVDFVICGVKRCRLIGDDIGMKKRIGRWRRDYDENGEEVVLGFGEERFLDVPEDYIGTLNNEHVNSSDSVAVDKPQTDIKSSPHKKISEWDVLPIEIYHDKQTNPAIDQKYVNEYMDRINLLLDEWYNLASSAKTYENLNVTAMTRVRKNAPLLYVQPDNLLNRVLKDLGPKPKHNIYDFAFWAAALINPLPPLGVSFEIRGKMLECYDLKEQLNILEHGIKRSIRNLTGEQPL